MIGPIRVALSLALVFGLASGPPGASAAAARHTEDRVQTITDGTRNPEPNPGDSPLPVPSPPEPVENATPDVPKVARIPPNKPDRDAPPHQQHKTDLLARRRRSRSPDDHGDAHVSEADDETEGDGLPPHKGAEEMFVGGMLMAISGVLKLQNVKGQAGMFLVLVFAIVGIMCSVMGALQQLQSYRKRKKWIKNQGSLLDHLKD